MTQRQQQVMGKDQEGGEGVGGRGRQTVAVVDGTWGGGKVGSRGGIHRFNIRTMEISILPINCCGSTQAAA